MNTSEMVKEEFNKSGQLPPGSTSSTSSSAVQAEENKSAAPKPGLTRRKTIAPGTKSAADMVVDEMVKKAEKEAQEIKTAAANPALKKEKSAVELANELPSVPASTTKKPKPALKKGQVEIVQNEMGYEPKVEVIEQNSPSKKPKPALKKGRVEIVQNEIGNEPKVEVIEQNNTLKKPKPALKKGRVEIVQNEIGNEPKVEVIEQNNTLKKPKPALKRGQVEIVQNEIGNEPKVEVIDPNKAANKNRPAIKKGDANMNLRETVKKKPNYVRIIFHYKRQLQNRHRLQKQSRQLPQTRPWQKRNRNLNWQMNYPPFRVIRLLRPNLQPRAGAKANHSLKIIKRRRLVILRPLPKMFPAIPQPHHQLVAKANPS